MVKKRFRLSPPHLVILSFATIIGAGALVLAAPFSAKEQPLDWVDALFLSTSAVCVTGLTPVDPGSTLSLPRTNHLAGSHSSRRAGLHDHFRIRSNVAPSTPFSHSKAQR